MSDTLPNGARNRMDPVPGLTLTDRLRGRARDWVSRKVNRARGRYDIDALRAAGMQLGRDIYIGNGVFLDPGVGFLIRIDEQAGISDHVMLITHDATPMRYHGWTQLAPIHLKYRAFVGAGAIVMPGVTIGEEAIVAAGSVVVRDVADGDIVAGNPAKPVGRTSELMERHGRQIPDAPKWDYDDVWPFGAEYPESERERIRQVIANSPAAYRR